jgi:hypothetical protein
MSRNDITGDSLVSKAATEEYRTNLERVFGVKKPWYIRRDEEARHKLPCVFCENNIKHESCINKMPTVVDVDLP